MAAKTNKNQEPCVQAVKLACPAATMNPKTKQPFCARTIRKVFTEDCYDFDPEHPWKFQNALQKVFLPTSVKEHRCTMSKYLLRQGPAPNWWAQQVVWIDPCASIIPGTQKQYEEMRQALKGKKRYISDDAKFYSRNLMGDPTKLKQASWGSTKMNWFMVLARGVVHVEVMPDTWCLNGEGMATFVERLPGILRRMLGPDARLPRTLFTDRGTGMYEPFQGKVVHKYRDAVAKAGFKLYWGNNAHKQSPDMGDMLLHETAISWVRKGMRAASPEVVPWEETPEMWTARIRKVVRAINAEFEVAALCREFPDRLQLCADSDGERLRK